MAYGDFKDLPRKTASGKVLCDTAFSIAKNPKYIKEFLPLRFINFLIKSLLLKVMHLNLLLIKMKN